MCSPRAVFTHVPAAPLTALPSDGSPIACPPNPRCPAFKQSARLTQSKQGLGSTWQRRARGVCLAHPRKPTTKGLRNSDKYKIFFEQPKGLFETAYIISLQGLSLYRERGACFVLQKKKSTVDRFYFLFYQMSSLCDQALGLCAMHATCIIKRILHISSC